MLWLKASATWFEAEPTNEPKVREEPLKGGRRHPMLDQIIPAYETYIDGIGKGKGNGDKLTLTDVLSWLKALICSD
jgi:hypothetical protein